MADSKTPKPKKSKQRKRSTKLSARTADKFAVYELAVQDAEHEVYFIDKEFRRIAGRPALTLREDFCGSAWVCAEWVKSRSERAAIGLDLDAAVLAWGRKHHIEPLGALAKRVTLFRRNVLDPPKQKVDAIAAFNYSYFIFKTRRDLVRYFDRAYASLKNDGIFFLDAYGGAEAYVEQKDPPRKCKGFRYIWEQASYNPLTSEVINHIHFQFSDKSKMKRAFTYDWRLWTLVEIREALEEVGFRRVHFYWEDADEDGEGNGTFRRRKKVPNDAGWNAYIVASKQD